MLIKYAIAFLSPNLARPPTRNHARCFRLVVVEAHFQIRPAFLGSVILQGPNETPGLLSVTAFRQTKQRPKILVCFEAYRQRGPRALGKRVGIALDNFIQEGGQ